MLLKRLELVGPRWRTPPGRQVGSAGPGRQRYRGYQPVIETSRPIAEVARELGINEGTLGNWCKLYRQAHASEEPPLAVSDRARLRELERENRDLTMQNEFLKKGVSRTRRAMAV